MARAALAELLAAAGMETVMLVTIAGVPTATSAACAARGDIRCWAAARTGRLVCKTKRSDTRRE